MGGGKGEPKCFKMGSITSNVFRTWITSYYKWALLNMAPTGSHSLLRQNFQNKVWKIRYAELNKLLKSVKETLCPVYRDIIGRKSEISNTAKLIMELSWKCPVSAGWVQLCGSQGRGRGHRCTDIYSNPGVVCGHWTGDKRWTLRSKVRAKFHPLWRSPCWKRQTEKAAEVWSAPAVGEINQSSCINTTQTKGIQSWINVGTKL